MSKRLFALPLLLVALHASAGNFERYLADGIAYRQRGDLRLSADALEFAVSQASSAEQEVLATGELGATYQQAKQYSQAEKYLTIAYNRSQGIDKGRYAIDLGNLALARKQTALALRRYREAEVLAGEQSPTGLVALLNQSRVTLSQRSLPRLEALANSCGQLPAGAEKIRLQLNLASQAKALGAPGLRLAFEQFDEARRNAESLVNMPLLVAAHDALAQLYEENGRADEAARLTDSALELLRQSGLTGDGMTHVRLLWRQGRLAVRRGDETLALVAYQAAVDQIETIRQDIPVEYDGDRSSFRETLEPVYLGLAERLLHLSDRQAGEDRQKTLRRTRAVIELIKQTEMQDYLGDRCSVDVAQSSDQIRAEDGTAVFYPVIFPDRLELLLETRNGLSRHTVPANIDAFRASAILFAAKLRNDPESELPEARKLYDLLLRPLAGELDSARVHTLVVVPDGVIRMIPLAALHDGRDYLLRRLAVATAPGLTMTHAREADRQSIRPFIAGLSDPGPVVAKLSANIIQTIGRNGENGQIRSAQDALRLPGVREEVQELSRRLGGKSLLNQGFTLANFRQTVESGDYGIIHIASHGLFGGSGDQSFVLTHDELLTMDGLQSLLNTEKLRRNRIQLLALSACETAGGNERAPLGIAGAALKARADAALGTLWPVDDEVAKLTMIRFYDAFVGEKRSKAQALRQAQLDLLERPASNHPAYWAPFVIVGDWH